MLRKEERPLDQIPCMHAVTLREIEGGLDLTSEQLRALARGEMLVRREILHQASDGRLVISDGGVMTYTQWRQLLIESNKRATEE